ncbi:fibronectin type III domain-containing protein [Candidatus Micrarchaeota archaeon]|nr:fibronectin type III domain-containing protein [Candidatus Micrarchaeota archaeon]
MRKTLLALLFFVASVSAVPPSQIHLSTTSDPATSITVMWQTPSSAATMVEYGETPLLGQRVEGREFRYSGYGGFLHEATLSLRPSTVYHYRVGDGTDWSEVYSFKTAPPLGSIEEFVAVAWGDQGHVHEEVPEAAASINPNLVLFAGDLAYGDNEDKVDKFFEVDEPLAATSLFMAVPGNHEYHDFGQNSDNALTFVNRFAFPRNSMYSYLDERTYSFNYGNAHFAFIDLGKEESDDEDQVDSNEVAAWLDADLAALPPGITWRVVVLHFNLYSTGARHRMSGHAKERQRFEPIFRRHGIDLVVMGHLHAYERMYPLADPDVAVDPNPNNLIFETDYENPAYPVYLVAGTGGSCCYEFGEGGPWSASRISDVGYVKFVFSGNTLKEEFRSPNHELRDSFTITKNSLSQPRDFGFSVTTRRFSMSTNVSQPLDFRINITQLFGEPRTFSLSTTCPDNVHCSIQPASGAFNSTATLRVIPNTNGTHRIALTVNSGDLSNSLQVAVYAPYAGGTAPASDPRPACVENRQCTEWSNCAGGNQRRACIDLNNCSPSHEEQRSCGETNTRDTQRTVEGLPLALGKEQRGEERSLLNSIIASILSFFSRIIDLIT